MAKKAAPKAAMHPMPPNGMMMSDKEMAAMMGGKMSPKGMPPKGMPPKNMPMKAGKKK